MNKMLYGISRLFYSLNGVKKINVGKVALRKKIAVVRIQLFEEGDNVQEPFQSNLWLINYHMSNLFHQLRG